MFVITELETPTGPKLKIRLRLDERKTVMSGSLLEKSHTSHDEQAQWLMGWLKGRTLIQGQELWAEAFYQAYPHALLKEAQFLEELVNQSLYQAHPKVVVTGVIICDCHQVSKETIEGVLERTGVITRERLGELTKAGTNCGKCHHLLNGIIDRAKVRERRWHGESHSSWALKIQESLDRWLKHNPQYPVAVVAKFDQGVVYLRVSEKLSGDAEWEMSQKLSDYWAEGFPAPLVVFFDFSAS